MRKKRILFHSNYSGSATGFGNFMRELLVYLYKTNKYELCLYAMGRPFNDPDFARWPWKTFGTISPNLAETELANRDPHLSRMMFYGETMLDKVIQEFKPDTYVFVDDFWGGSYTVDRPWFNKINCMFSWTADSVPILHEAINKAPKIKHHYVWSSFAEREFQRLAIDLEKNILLQENKLNELKEKDPTNYQNNINNFNIWKQQSLERIEGYKRVKTLHGTIDTNVFKKLPNYQRQELRKKFNIPQDCFVIGEDNRNQLRKLKGTIIEGYSIFKRQNPEIKNTKLIFLTCAWDSPSGWQISRLVEYFKVDPNEVLAVYRCRETGEMFILPFRGEGVDCPHGHKNALAIAGINNPLNIEQVNEFYNLLDCGVSAITSGGMERSCAQVLATEGILVANSYSSNEEYFLEKNIALEIDQNFTWEAGTGFKKAAPFPSSIAKQFKKVYEMSPQERSDMGKRARKWAIDNFSIEVVGKKYEEILDALPIIEDYDFNFEEKSKNPNAVIENIPDNNKWIISLYKEILGMDVNETDSGFLNWKSQLDKGAPRAQVEKFFRDVARTKNQEIESKKPIAFESLLENNGKKHFLIVCKESAGDLFNATSLFESFREQYPENEWNIYVACDPAFAEILDANSFITKCIPYLPFMENEIVCTGAGQNKGPFDGYCFLTLATQRQLNYLTNNNIALELQ